MTLIEQQHAILKIVLLLMIRLSSLVFHNKASNIWFRKKKKNLICVRRQFVLSLFQSHCIQSKTNPTIFLGICIKPHGMKTGLWSSFQIRSPFNLGTHSNSGLEGNNPFSASQYYIWSPQTVLMVTWMSDTYELD